MLKIDFGQLKTYLRKLRKKGQSFSKHELKASVAFFGGGIALGIMLAGLIFYIYIAHLAAENTPATELTDHQVEPLALTLDYAQAEGVVNGTVAGQTTLYTKSGEVVPVSEGKFSVTGLTDIYTLSVRHADLLFDLTVKLSQEKATATCAGSENSTDATGQFVASKNSKLYHPITNCAFADRINPENRIYFNSREEAEKAGFSPSSCFD